MEFVEINGSQGEGGGQILRTSVSLSCILGRPVCITNIRSKRRQPGLRPQHLHAIKAAAEITNSQIFGAELGSTRIEFIPGKLNGQISSKIDVGTAGSTTLIAQTLIPIGIFCKLDLELEITGGTENPLAPTIDYLQRIVVPMYHAMGGRVTIVLKRRGYYPRGGGLINVRVEGSKSAMHPIELAWIREKDFKVESRMHMTARVLSVSRSLPKHVAQRQLESASRILKHEGVTDVTAEIDSEGTSFSPGSSVLVYNQSKLQYVGADSLGQKGKLAEKVGMDAASAFLEEYVPIHSVDSHLADMMVTILSCVQGKSSFTTTKKTSHLETNLNVSKMLSGSDFRITQSNDLFQIEITGREKDLSLNHV